MFRELCLLLASLVIDSVTGESFVILGNPIGRAHICNNSRDIEAIYQSGLPPDEENQYTIKVYKRLPQYSKVVIKFDSEATATLTNETVARISANNDLSFSIHFFKNAGHLGLFVKGPSTGAVPYPTSIYVNGYEICETPLPGFLDNMLQGYRGTAHVTNNVPQGDCGRKKVVHTELIVNGQPTKAGDWPWHAALYRLEGATLSYICGGTLISKNFVLTAGHCVVINGATVLPEIMSVVFGKYNLKGGDISSQEREVHEIILHNEYYHKRLDNDIALIKLKTEVIFDDYVQPACVWKWDTYKKLSPGIVYGTVVGWGLDHNRNLSSQLHQVLLPRISDSTCIKSKTDFFGRILNDRKFCAGYRNGTSACNGDSGGAFTVFVPDVYGDTKQNATGAYYVHGIVSLALSQPNVPICDEYQYSLFTNVVSFISWIEKHIRTL